MRARGGAARRAQGAARRSASLLVQALLQEALRGHPERAEGDAGPSLLRAWLPDLARRLDGPADRVALELAIRRLADVGTYAARFGVGPEARALAERVLPKWTRDDQATIRLRREK
ncbi:hypothetical protein WME76_21705 [Sorangium sp. So ce119]|uniref:hypothetical protein n=1 Tax=Sorangium sp. So ce119 TaxID=3133279 RepID=UPI003F5DD288